MSVPAPLAYDYVDEAHIPKELFCAVCLRPWVVPFETPCEHVYCYSCIYPIANSAHNSSCPMCRCPITVEGLRRVTRVLREQVESLVVNCRKSGCAWTGPRSAHTAHVCLAPTLTVVTEYNAYVSTHAHCITGVVHIQAPHATTRKPISLSCCLDRSGSMAGEKLALLKETMRFVATELRDDDHLAIVCYDENVWETLPLTTMTPDGKTRALAAIDGIVHGGMTNISAGLFAGLDALKESPPFELFLDLSNDYSPMKRDGVTMHRYCVVVHPSNASSVVSVTARADDGAAVPVVKEGGDFSAMFVSKTRVAFMTLHVTFQPSCAMGPCDYTQPLCEVRADSTQRVAVTTCSRTSHVAAHATASTWLFTDGQANMGVTKPDELCHAVRRRMYDGTVFAFGLGSDHNRDLLSAVSSATGGMYYFIDSVASMKSSFADCLGGLVSVVCRGLRLTVDVPEGVTLCRVLTKYRHEVTATGGAVIVLHDLYSEEQRDVVFEVDLGAGETGGIVVSATLEHSDKQSRLVATASVARTVAPDVHATPHPLVDEQRNRLRVMQGLKDADRAAKQGDYLAARARLVETNHALTTSSTYHTSLYAQRLAAQVHETARMVGSKEAYATEGQYQVTAWRQEHGAQRCARSSKPTASPQFYSNEMKDALRERATPK